LSRRRRLGALRLLSPPSGDSAAGGRLPADSANELRGRAGRPLRAGVVRHADSRDTLAGQLREGEVRPARLGALSAVRLRSAARPESAAVGEEDVPGLQRRGEARLGLRALPRAAQALDGACGLAGATVAEEGVPARRARVPAGEALGGRLLEPAARGRRSAAGPGPARDERGAEPPDPEPASRVALQRRERLRALVVGDG